ncbi:MAG TPA: cation transporter [Clostridia bacterium]|nr:cation transporter [Clostridia bacterium]
MYLVRRVGIVDSITRYREISKVLWQVLVLNWAVASAKIILGYLSGSASMTADGFHSLDDGASNIVGLIGIKIASRPVDEDHPYGHKKYETLASAAIGAMLFAVALGVARSAVSRLLHPVTPEITAASFIVMFGTMVVNGLVSRYERRAGVRLQSDVLISDSKHTRSDLFVSGSVIASLIAVRLGFSLLDTISSLVIAGLIGASAYGIWKESFGVLVDQSRIDGDEIKRIALAVSGVEACHRVRSRGRDDDLKIDLHIQVKPDMSIEDAHQVGHKVEERIREEYSNVTDVVVHTEPFAGVDPKPPR